jgi:dihydroorotate dehydrogenase
LRAHLPASIPLIGCGGISTGADALEYAKAGASLVQVYTSFGYDGAGSCRRIKDELVEAFEKEGSSWSEVVQKAVGELSWKAKGKTPVDDAVDMTIGQLIVEAEELKSLLDRLGQKMDVEERARHDSVIPAVS